MKTVLVPIAPGFEETEAITVIDILRRGNVRVVVAGLEVGPIEGRSGIQIAPEALIEQVPVEELDMIVLPGGMPGAKHLKENPKVREIVKTLHEQSKITAAICAAPTVLSAMGLLDGKKVTSFPSFQDKLPETHYSEDRVVVDGNIITSRSPGTAMEFALKLLELLEGKEVMEKVNQGVMAKL